MAALIQVIEELGQNGSSRQVFLSAVEKFIQGSVLAKLTARLAKFEPRARNICLKNSWLTNAVETPNDGVSFDMKSVKGEPITLDKKYHGVRVRVRGSASAPGRVSRLAVKVETSVLSAK